MPTEKLTTRLLDNVTRPASGTVRIWDTETKGFVAHVQKTTTTLYYDRNNQRHLIGRYPTISLPLAREAARELDVTMRRGVGKMAKKSDPFLSEMVNAYCARPKLRSDKWKAAVRHAIEDDLKWGRKRVSEVTPAMCRDMHARLLKRGPTAANQIMQALHTVWAFARKQDGTLPEPPTTGMEWYPEERGLNAPVRDLPAWRNAVEEVSNPVHRTAYLFALFTGLRRSELEALEWDRVTDAIHLPVNKSGREFWLPLVETHHRILDAVRGLDPRWVFPADSASGHIVAWDHDDVPGTLHSLRHTFATVGVEAGLPEEVVGRLLNHAAKSITGQRYVRPNLDFMRAAMKVVVDEIERRVNMTV